MVYNTGQYNNKHMYKLDHTLYLPCYFVSVSTGHPTIDDHNHMDTVVLLEDDDVTLTCISSGGVPDPVLSWYIDSGSGLIDPPLAGPGPSPVTLQYTGVRGYNGDNLVCPG